MEPLPTLKLLVLNARVESFETVPPNIVKVVFARYLVRGFIDITVFYTDVEI